ncbi:hypothetical protein ACU635_01205 [[Actinomadura] parvosata]|uniref:hypothetical protein n=1 Tax=[Actinomadura] parvosata TaxID=1955412 RepID=UPI00406BE5D6
MAAAWLTAALFVLIAGVFSIPYAVQIISDGCTDSIQFGGWDIVMYGPILHYVAGAVLVAFLALIRREEGGCGPAPREQHVHAMPCSLGYLEGGPQSERDRRGCGTSWLPRRRPSHPLYRANAPVQRRRRA